MVTRAFLWVKGGDQPGLPYLPREDRGEDRVNMCCTVAWMER